MFVKDVIRQYHSLTLMSWNSNRNPDIIHGPFLSFRMLQVRL